MGWGGAPRTPQKPFGVQWGGEGGVLPLVIGVGAAAGGPRLSEGFPSLPAGPQSGALHPTLRHAALGGSLQQKKNAVSHLKNHPKPPKIAPPPPNRDLLCCFLLCSLEATPPPLSHAPSRLEQWVSVCARPRPLR